MKRFFLVMFCFSLVFLTARSQTKAYLDTLEQAFRTMPYVDSNDIVIRWLQNSQLSFSLLNRYPKGFLIDSNFIAAEEAISQLDKDHNDTIHQSLIKFVADYVKSESNPAKNLYIQVHFSQKTCDTKDSVALKQLLDFVNSDPERITLVANRFFNNKTSLEWIGEAYEGLGDLLVTGRFYENSLIAYLISKQAYDSLSLKEQLAIIERKIGLLYYKVRDNAEAIKHFYKAAEIFHSEGNLNSAFSCILQASEIAIWIKSHATFKQILEETGLRILRKNYNVSTIEKQITDDEEINKRIEIFNNIQLALSLPANNEIKFRIYSLLGSYYSEKTEFELGKKFYNSALHYACDEDAVFDVDKVLFCVNHLAWISSQLNKVEDILKYSDLEIEINREFDDEYGAIWSQFSKSDYLLYAKRIDDALYVARNATDEIKKANISWKAKESLYRIAYNDLGNINGLLHRQDSVRYYHDLYAFLESKHNAEEIKMNQLEKDYESEKFEYEMDRINVKILNLSSQINLLEKVRKGLLGEKTKLANKIARKSKDLNDLRGKYYSLVDSTNVLGLMKKKLSDEVDALKGKVLKYTLATTLIFAFGLVTLFTVVVLNNRRIIQKNKILNQRDVEIEQNKIMLDQQNIELAQRDKMLLQRGEELKQNTNVLIGQARLKAHDLENNYSDLLDLFPEDDNSKAKLYLVKSTRYLRHMLGSGHWDEGTWTLQDELDSLNLFVEIKKIINPNIQLQVEIDNTIDLNSTCFIPEVLTLFFQNTVQHAFEQNEHGIFRVSGKKTGDVLLFEVCDNGTPRDTIEDYLPSSDPNHGLNILRKIITNIAKTESLAHIDNPFKIVLDNGTKYQFILPYRTAA